MRSGVDAMSKLSDIIKQAEWAAKKKARVADIRTGDEEYVIVVQFTDKSIKFMRSDDAVEVDWVWTPERAAYEKRIADDL